MKNKIHYSPASLQDLDEIWEYIAVENDPIDAAEHVVRNIFNLIHKLEDFSKLGITLYAVTKVSNEYRFLVSGHYLIFYRTKEQNVFIDRILHSRKDYIRILFEEK